MVATVGTMRFSPDVVNVVPARAVFTVDLRDPDEARLAGAEAALAAKLAELARDEGVKITTEPLARFHTVVFDDRIVGMIEASARARSLPCRRMTSGAGQDAQMLARICPTAMIFVPSRQGISHNPAEYTAPEDVVAGASVLLDVLRGLVAE
jgi:N-carbamoyl-L-amino-acid hydrolase